MNVNFAFLWKKNYRFYLMPPNTTFPVPPAVLTGEGKRAAWVIPVLPAFATAFPRTVGVFLF